MQNFAPFWTFVTSRFINVFFWKNSHPLPDTKIDHYSDNEGDYWLGDQMFFWYTSWAVVIHIQRLYLLIRIRKRMPKRQNGGNREIAEPKQFFCLYPQNIISTCLIKSTKACKSTIQSWWTKLSLLWATWSPIWSEIEVDSWTGWGNCHYFDCTLKVYHYFFIV